MVALCFYFQLHQPFRLHPYRVSQIGAHQRYFDDAKNAAVFRKVSRNCYRPMGELLLRLLRTYGDEFKVTFSLSGTFIEQCEDWDPGLLRLYRDILAEPGADLLCETSHHTLASLRAQGEFEEQVRSHRETLSTLFSRGPKVFRNTELIYSDAIGERVARLGFEGCLLEGWDRFVPKGWSAHHLFHHPRAESLKLLPKSYRLSDDIAFRFSDRAWPAWPLTAPKYMQWLENLVDGRNEFVGLFMDYETFGEHQWEETGIFAFFEDLVDRIARHRDIRCVTATEAVQALPARAPMRVPVPLSWADSERDLSAWLSNGLQEEAFARIYGLHDDVLRTGNPHLVEEWRRLQCSDHFYYMCIKHSRDGDVHKYFSPFESPYDAYMDYLNVVEDFELKCLDVIEAREAKEDEALSVLGEGERVPHAIVAAQRAKAARTGHV